MNCYHAEYKKTDKNLLEITITKKQNSQETLCYTPKSGRRPSFFLSAFAHYSPIIKFIQNLFGRYHLFVILNIQCKFGMNLIW